MKVSVISAKADLEKIHLIRDAYHVMIKSFSCKETLGIWEGKASRKLPTDIQERAFRKLRQLNAARTLDDLKEPPSNNLEALKGGMKGYMSIRINKQWRLRFSWDGSDATEVEIIDYH